MKFIICFLVSAECCLPDLTLALTTVLVVQQGPPVVSRFPDGVNEFLVERRPRELAVWARARPAHVATIPVSEASDSLRVKGWRWTRFMQVDYTG